MFVPIFFFNSSSFIKYKAIIFSDASYSFLIKTVELSLLFEFVITSDAFYIYMDSINTKTKCVLISDNYLTAIDVTVSELYETKYN